MRLKNAMNVTVFKDSAALSEAASHRIANLARQFIVARGAFRIALAGGETPRRCYEHLRHLPIEWRSVQVYFGDERCLPRGDAQRNDSMAYETLLKHVPIPSENVHTIPAELGARVASAVYAAQLEQPLDLVLLGMGEDGHTASLFPEDPATDSAASAVAVYAAPKPPRERVSLGMHTLNASKEKLFLVTGDNKRVALNRIALGAALPAARVIGAEWYVDRAAWPEDQN
jgi:6-phosphogluconolactonase